jgi:hypothetical protein
MFGVVGVYDEKSNQPAKRTVYDVSHQMSQITVLHHIRFTDSSCQFFKLASTPFGFR